MLRFDYKKENFDVLIKFSQAGDLKALEELVRRVQKNVFSILSYLVHERSDVADLTQEVLVRMAKSINTLKEPKCFKSWLNHITSNVFHDYIKVHLKDNSIVHNENKILEIKDKAGCEPGEKCLYTEMENLIRIALHSLPSHLRLVIILREYEGLSYEDIAHITNTNLGTVKSRIARARVKLQHELKDFI